VLHGRVIALQHVEETLRPPGEAHGIHGTVGGEPLAHSPRVPEITPFVNRRLRLLTRMALAGAQYTQRSARRNGPSCLAEGFVR
jgi:hypothetical protein